MPYKFENELRDRAESYVKTLIQSGVGVEPYPVMFRDYTVKLAVQNMGYINIYYSPKKDTFSIKLHELRDKSLETVIEACWEGENILTTESSQIEGYQAYVDGSFIEGFVGYGAVILNQGQEIKRFFGSVEQYIEQRQVVGELQATIQVLAWCEQNNIIDIEIFYDYEGIQKWATGEWRANNAATQQYKQTVNNSPVQIIWNKVKSHTGVHWNEIADELAKQGALSHASERNVTNDNPLNALEHTALDFVAYLAEQSIEAEYTKIYNEQYARIIILGGYFDLYNTRKRPMSPYMHNFKDNNILTQIEQLWKQFHFGIVDDLTDEVIQEYEEIEHYLSIFEPYRDLPFDFSVLAHTIQSHLNNSRTLPTDNYNELERIYKELLGHNNEQ